MCSSCNNRKSISNQKHSTYQTDCKYLNIIESSLISLFSSSTGFQTLDSILTKPWLHCCYEDNTQHRHWGHWEQSKRPLSFSSPKYKREILHSHGWIVSKSLISKRLMNVLFIQANIPMCSLLHEQNLGI